MEKSKRLEENVHVQPSLKSGVVEKRESVICSVEVSDVDSTDSCVKAGSVSDNATAGAVCGLGGLMRTSQQRRRQYRGFHHFHCERSTKSAPIAEPSPCLSQVTSPSTLLLDRHSVKDTHRKIRSTKSMDYEHSPESFYSPDFVKSAFSASPHSLYMYDQEHCGMQSPLTKGVFGQTSATPGFALLPTEPDFDLNPQYENSNSLDGFFAGALSNGVASAAGESGHTASKKPRLGETGWMTLDTDEVKEAPILTELNMNPYLFEDLHSASHTKERPHTAISAKLTMVDVGKRASMVQPDVPEKTFTALKCVKTNQSTAVQRLVQAHSQTPPSLSSLLTNRTASGAAAASSNPFPTVKTEPVDPNTDISHTSHLHQMLTSPTQKSDDSSSILSPPATSSRARGAGDAAQGRLVKSGSVEEKWKEIEKFIHDPDTPSGSRKRKRNASGESAIGSDDESIMSRQVGSFSDEDSDSDADSDISDAPFEESLIELAKKSKQYFWQYNVQAKGPKGTRLQLTIDDTDPHHPTHFEDPVFDAKNTSLVGIRHGGKARKGDGNEVTPNPRKLFQIGQKLCRLNREINSLQVTNDLPAGSKNKSRREKNRLSSQACRLKKKAAHEANKVKLFGLNCEQGELLQVIRMVWPCLRERAQLCRKKIQSSPSADTITKRINGIIASQHKTVVAGNTADYVNRIIARVEEGDPAGGLPIKPKIKK